MEQTHSAFYDWTFEIRPAHKRFNFDSTIFSWHGFSRIDNQRVEMDTEWLVSWAQKAHKLHTAVSSQSEQLWGEEVLGEMQWCCQHSDSDQDQLRQGHRRIHASQLEEGETSKLLSRWESGVIPVFNKLKSQMVTQARSETKCNSSSYSTWTKIWRWIWHCIIWQIRQQQLILCRHWPFIQ